MKDFAERLESVRGRVSAACARVKREEDVKIVAVTKTFDSEDVRVAVECGLTVMGESKVQEARQKIPLCPGSIEWHMIGHLQKNKVKNAVQLFRMIHSVDSFELLEVIDTACKDAGVEMPVCLEVNVSGEGSKFGMAPENIGNVIERSETLLNVSIEGLMTIPPFTEDVEGARPYFRRLRELRDECRSRTGVDLKELSMGMSHDFEVAVEEGATYIRLGSVLFGERKKKAFSGVAVEEL